MIVVGLYFVPILLTVSYFAALTKLNHWLNGKGPSPSGDAMSMVTFYGALTFAFVSVIGWTYLMVTYLW